jgi:hypothetical protein
MQHIFSNMVSSWEERPLTVEEAKIVEIEMIKSLKDLILGIETSASSEQIVHLLNKAISSYMFLFN